VPILPQPVPGRSQTPASSLAAFEAAPPTCRSPGRVVAVRPQVRSGENGGESGKPPVVVTPSPEPNPPHRARSRLTASSAGEAGDETYWDARQTALGIDTHGEILEPDEIVFCERMGRLHPDIGLSDVLEWISRDDVTFKPTSDFVWLPKNSPICELKTQKAKYSTIADEIKDTVVRSTAHGLPKKNFVIDIGNKTLTQKLFNQLAKYNQRNPTKRIERLFVMHSGGAMTEVCLI
jgi:hypothetical protein